MLLFWTYISFARARVVGDLEALEADGILHPGVAIARRVWMPIHLHLSAGGDVAGSHFTPFPVDVLVAPLVGLSYSGVDVVFLLWFKAIQSHH